MKQTSEWKWWAVAVLVLVVAAIIFAKILPIAVNKMEVVDCLKLKAYSEQFDGFYLTEAEAGMCERQKIEINAPVGDPYEKQQIN